MATLPRASRSHFSDPIPSTSYSRPHSDFDAGINASTAWTEHLELLSDDEPDREDDYRPARALYDFEGKAEFRELSLQAGDDIEVVKEDLADGWSLVRNSDGEVGLLPREYYTVRCFPLIPISYLLNGFFFDLYA